MKKKVAIGLAVILLVILGGTIIINNKKGSPEKTSQRKFADMLQIQGIDVDKNAIQRIESGQRFITDIELKAIASILHVSSDTLLDINFSQTKKR